MIAQVTEQAGYKISDHSEKINKLIKENERIRQTNEKKIYVNQRLNEFKKPLVFKAK
jgi:hypothetical protein